MAVAKAETDMQNEVAILCYKRKQTEKWMQDIMHQHEWSLGVGVLIDAFLHTTVGEIVVIYSRLVENSYINQQERMSSSCMKSNSYSQKGGGGLYKSKGSWHM